MVDKTKRVEDKKEAQPSSFPLTLDEFCARLSGTDDRVELIGGFHAAEVRSGNVKDTSENYMDRFNKFLNKEVK